jgi:DNA-binding LacI/PurR family transcriptional regulator
MQGLLDQEPRPDAVFVTNHLMTTIGTLQAIAQAKLVIPFDIAVISLDDTPWVLLLPPRTHSRGHCSDHGVVRAKVVPAAADRLPLSHHMIEIAGRRT